MEQAKRRSIGMNDAATKKIVELAKKVQLTQGEVLSVIVEHADSLSFLPLFEKMRQGKLEQRAGKSETRAKLQKLIDTMSPEQLADLMKQAGGNK